jgi:hypothetical protein
LTGGVLSGHLNPAKPLTSQDQESAHGVVRWRIIDLCQWVWDEFAIVTSQQTLSRELRAMGYCKLSARPRHHAQAPGAIDAFKKSSPRCWQASRESGASIPAT